MKGRMKGGALIGSGSYGCVFAPPKTCLKTSPNTNQYEDNTKFVGKILSDDNARDERHKSNLMKTIDPNSEFSLHMVHKCSTESQNFTLNEKQKCKFINGQQKLYAQNIYPNGGVPINTKGQIPNKTEFYKMSIPLFEGIQKLISADLIHCDIKPDNIVYSREHNKMFLIDFSLLDKWKHIALSKSIINYPYLYFPLHFKHIGAETLHKFDNMNTGYIIDVRHATNYKFYTHQLLGYQTLDHMNDALTQLKLKLQGTTNWLKKYTEAVVPYVDLFSLSITLKITSKELYGESTNDICNAFESFLDKFMDVALSNRLEQTKQQNELVINTLILQMKKLFTNKNKKSPVKKDMNKDQTRHMEALEDAFKKLGLNNSKYTVVHTSDNINVLIQDESKNPADLKKLTKILIDSKYIIDSSPSSTTSFRGKCRVKYARAPKNIKIAFATKSEAVFDQLLNSSNPKFVIDIQDWCKTKSLTLKNNGLFNSNKEQIPIASFQQFYKIVGLQNISMDLINTGKNICLWDLRIP